MCVLRVLLCVSSALVLCQPHTHGGKYRRDGGGGPTQKDPNPRTYRYVRVCRPDNQKINNKNTTLLHYTTSHTHIHTYTRCCQRCIATPPDRLTVVDEENTTTAGDSKIYRSVALDDSSIISSWIAHIWRIFRLLVSCS